MSLKRILGIFSVYSIVIFVVVLVGSYAWYSFEKGSTTFDAVTGNKDIIVSYNSGKYINTSSAIPVNSSAEAEKNNFTVNVRDELAGKYDILVDVSLVDIEIDNELKNSNFKYSLLKDGVEIANGNFSNVSSSVLVLAKNVEINSYYSNSFELRIWIQNNGGDQSSMSGKTFKGTVSVGARSRVV